MTQTHTQKEYTAHPKGWEKQNQGDIPKKTSENNLKTDSIIVNNFYDI
jgi:hypothetical protein